MGFSAADVDAALARASGDGDAALEALLSSTSKKRGREDERSSSAAPLASRRRTSPPPAVASGTRHRVWRRNDAAPAAARAAAPAEAPAAARAAAPARGEAGEIQPWHIWLQEHATADSALFNCRRDEATSTCAERLAAFKRVAGLAASGSATDSLISAAQSHLKVAKDFSETQLQRQSAGLHSNTRKSADAASAQCIVSQHRAALESLLAPGLVGGDLSVEMLISAHAIMLSGQPHAGELRTTSNARCGSTSFLPPRRVASEMEEYVTAVNTLCARSDVDAMGAAAGAHCGLLAIHPFHDGNGRIGRIVMNWVLAKRGLPFTVVASSSDEQRADYIRAVKSSARPQTAAGGDVLSFASYLAAVCGRAWAELDRLVARSLQLREEAAAVAMMRTARERSRADGCMICLDDGCNIATLCCGAACHLNCLAQWLAEAGEPTCCQCREPLPRPPRSSAPPPAAQAPPAAANDEEQGGNDSETSTSTATSSDDSATSVSRDQAHSPSRSEDEDDSTTTTTTTTSAPAPAPQSDNDTTTTSEDDATTSCSRSRSPSPRERRDNRGRLVCNYCSSQPANSCSNFSCGRCCVSNGRYRCARHNN
jgi:fido (protein-threonine AMPylation protein)